MQVIGPIANEVGIGYRSQGGPITPLSESKCVMWKKGNVRIKRYWLSGLYRWNQVSSRIHMLMATSRRDGLKSLMKELLGGGISDQLCFLGT